VCEPEYFGSSLSSFRSLCLTSMGSCCGGAGELSDASAPSLFCCSGVLLPFSFVAVAAASSAAFVLEASVGVAAVVVCAGVPALLGVAVSPSSPITNSGSNSDGSGSLPVGIVALSVASCSFLVRLLDGDIVLDPDRCRDVLFRGEAVAAAVLCLACSSWILESTASLKRYSEVLVKVFQVFDIQPIVPEGWERCRRTCHILRD
jgi:hypothetical protein